MRCRAGPSWRSLDLADVNGVVVSQHRRVAVRRPRSVARWAVPTSHFHQINEIVELIKRTAPDSLLDVGVGFGKFGLLAREYLDVWNERLDKKDWKARIEGVEVFPQYLTPVHHHVY